MHANNSDSYDLSLSCFVAIWPFFLVFLFEAIS